MITWRTCSANGTTCSRPKGTPSTRTRRASTRCAACWLSQRSSRPNASTRTRCSTSCCHATSRRCWPSRRADSSRTPLRSTGKEWCHSSTRMSAASSGSAPTSCLAAKERRWAWPHAARTRLLQALLALLAPLATRLRRPTTQASHRGALATDHPAHWTMCNASDVSSSGIWSATAPSVVRTRRLRAARGMAGSSLTATSPVVGSLAGRPGARRHKMDALEEP